MKKQTKGLLVAVMALTGVVGTCFETPLSPIQSVHAESYSMTAQATERLNKLRDANKTMESNSTLANIHKAMDAFSTLFTSHGADEEGDMAMSLSGQAKKEFNRILNAVNKKGESEKNTLTIRFFNQMGLRYGNHSAFYYDDFLNALLDNTKHAKTLDTLMIASGQLNSIFASDGITQDVEKKKDLFHIKGGELKLIKPLNDIPDAETKAPEKLEALPVEVNTPVREKSDKNYDPASHYDKWESISYDVIDGKTYKTTTTFTRKNGKVTKREKREEVKAHEAFAGTAEDWKMFNGGILEGGLNPDDINADKTNNDDDMLSNMTLHYTVSKHSEDTYYFDTGMRVDQDENATYQQVRDVLYQLAVRAQGYLAEDDGKFLIVVEGKPVLVRDIKETHTKEDIESMFKGFKEVDMRIMPTRIGTTASLEEQLVSGQEQSVLLNGEELELQNHPMIEGGQILLSIEELASLLDLNYEIKDAKHIVSDKDNVVVYEEGVKSVTINKEVIDIKAPTIVNEQGVLMGDISELLNTFAIRMVWDEENSAIILETNN